jgi:hypothetical protein
MSKWGSATPAERKDAPASVFCGPGRSFPVADEEDFSNAVHALGRAKGDTSAIKACLIGKAKAHGWTLPASWQAQHSATQVAAFDAGDAVIDDEWVIRRGKVFEAGDYPDKDFAATPEDLYLAALDFAPVPNDIEHHPSILDGKLGELTAVELSDDGDALIGETRIPKWLHDQIGDAPLKVSLAWDRATKRIVGNGLVLNPRVPDAALMSAYAAFAGRRHSATDQDAVQAVHDHAVTLGATCPTQAQMSAKEQGMADVPTTPTRMERFFAWLSGEGVNDAEFGSDRPIASPVTSTIPQPDPEKEQMRQRLEAIERERITEKAAAFADGEILAHRAYPAERDALVAMFTEAADDDRTTPRTVTFSADGEAKTGSRVDALIARQSARTPHTLTQEHLGDARVLPSAAPDSTAPVTMSKERREHLHKLAGMNFTS